MNLQSAVSFVAVAADTKMMGRTMASASDNMLQMSGNSVVTIQGRNDGCSRQQQQSIFVKNHLLNNPQESGTGEDMFLLRVRMKDSCKKELNLVERFLYSPRTGLKAEARSASGVLRGVLAARPVSSRRHGEISQQASVGLHAITRDSTVSKKCHYTYSTEGGSRWDT